MRKFDTRGSDPLFNLVIYSTLIFSLLIVALPFYYVIISSLSTKHEVITRGFYLIPKDWTFNMIVMRSFFQSIPYELEEAARMDGCGEFKLFWKIILPLSKPAIATFTLFYMVVNWNMYFGAILYLNDSSKWPLQVFLRTMLLEGSDDVMEIDSGGFEYGPPVKMAAVLITAIPLLIVYPFLQKYFNKGMLLGSVKG